MRVVSYRTAFTRNWAWVMLRLCGCSMGHGEFEVLGHSEHS